MSKTIDDMVEEIKTGMLKDKTEEEIKQLYGDEEDIKKSEEKLKALLEIFGPMIKMRASMSEEEWDNHLKRTKKQINELREQEQLKAFSKGKDDYKAVKVADCCY